MEFQAELASPGSTIVEFSTDGGSTFDTTSNYSNGYYDIETNKSEALLGENNNTNRLEMVPPPQTGSGIAQHVRIEVFSADSTLFTNTFAMKQTSEGGGADWNNHSGILQKAEKHNALRIRLDGGGIARAFVRVKGLAK
jgi:hypothetical protein